MRIIALPTQAITRDGTVNLSDFGALGERRYAGKLLIRRSAEGCFPANSTRIFVKLTIPYEALVAGDPPIYMQEHGPADQLGVDPFNVAEDQLETIIRRLREELTRS